MRPTRDFWTDALCAQTGYDLFFAEHRGDNISVEAKRICSMCDVRERCLEWALDQPTSYDQHGVFGGFTPEERNEIRGQRREAA